MRAGIAEVEAGVVLLAYDKCYERSALRFGHNSCAVSALQKVYSMRITVKPVKTDDSLASYRVFWDAYWPLSCYGLHADPVNVNLSSFGIAANGNGNGSMSAEHGGALTMWSHNPHHRLHNGLGLYPYYSLSGTCKYPDPNVCNDTNAVHGGVPQLAILNLSAHIAKLKTDINNPNGCAACGDYSLPVDFDGLGVLDWESWSFTWSHMTKLQGWTAKTDVRVNKSIELVLADHPHMPIAEAEVEAGKRWDAAVKIFIEATLATLHELRPHGKFGIFGYPDCGPQSGYSAAGPLACSPQFQTINDNELSWLWEASSALFPGYYISAPPGHYPHDVNVTYDSNRRGVDTTVAEAVRVARSAPAGKRPQTFLYAK